MDISQERFLKPGEVCAMLRISRSTLWSLRKSGDFPASFRIGKSERFAFADIEKIVSANKKS